MGFVMGLLLWAFGLLWLFFATASVLRARKFPFNLGWWAFTFPLGVYATCTSQLGREMPSRFFKVVGTVCTSFQAGLGCWLTVKILSVCVVLLWVLVTLFTAKGIYKRSLFVAPCLADLREKQQRKLDEQRRERVNA